MEFLKIYSYTITVILSLLLEKVYTQVAISVVTPDPFKCDKTLRLQCASTAGGSCCSGSKSWRVDGSSITTGTSAEDSKYTKEDSGSYFNLVINQLEPSDFDKKYICEHDFDTSPSFEPTGNFHCDKCGGYGYLFGFAGVEVALFFCVIVVRYLEKFRWDWKVIILTAIISNLISLVILIPSVVPACIVDYLCIKIPRLDPLFVLVGLALEVIFFILSHKILDKCPPCSGTKKEESNAMDTKPKKHQQP